MRTHNSSLRVGKLFGALGVNLSSDEEWAGNFEHSGFVHLLYFCGTGTSERSTTTFFRP